MLVVAMLHLNQSCCCIEKFCKTFSRHESTPSFHYFLIIKSIKSHLKVHSRACFAAVDHNFWSGTVFLGNVDVKNLRFCAPLLFLDIFYCVLNNCPQITHLYLHRCVGKKYYNSVLLFFVFICFMSAVLS